MKSKLWVTAVAAIHLAGFSSVAHSQENQPATDELKLLRRKIEELEKKVRELEQKTAPVTTNKTIRRSAPQGRHGATISPTEQLISSAQAANTREPSIEPPTRR